MHESTRRFICRVTFLALCLAPSGVLSAWIVYLATPLHAWQENTCWARAIYETTGLLAEVQLVRHPTRTRTILENVTLRDPDGERLIARIRVVELADTERGIVAIASQPEIEANQLHRLGQVFYQRVLRGPRPAHQFQLLSGELTLHGGSGALTAGDVRCLITSDEQQTEATIDFTLAGFEMQNPAQIQLTRARGSEQASTTWRLQTGKTALPCDLAADYFTGLRALGNRCRFQGTVWVQQDDQDWEGEVAGQFLDVDLESLIAPFPHKLSGTAEITLSHTNFRRGKLVEAAGALSSDGGVISRSLLTAAADCFRLDSNPASDEQADTLLAYRQLALGFQIDATGLQLSGQCDGHQEGVLLEGTNGNLLLDSPDALLPSVALAQALVPQSELQVPATPATEQLLRVLPLPNPTQPSSATARRPYSPVRLR